MTVIRMMLAAVCVNVAMGVGCGTSVVHDCGTLHDEIGCGIAYIPPQAEGGQGRNCKWFAYEGSYSCVSGDMCDMPTPAPPTPPQTPVPDTPTPDTPAPTPSPLVSPVVTPDGTPTADDGSDSGMSKGIQTLLFFLSYLGAILTFWGGIKTYRYFYPPESKTQQALSLLRGGKK